MFGIRHIVEGASGGDFTGTYDRVEMDYYADGSLETRKDQRGCIHTFEYDDRGRQTADKVTTAPDDDHFDDGVLRIDRGYDDRGDRSGSTVNNKVRNEAWGLSAVGNWNDYQINTNPAEDSDYTDAGDLDQDREHNKVNEIYDATDAITEQSDPQQAQWADPVYSARGNATTIPRPNDLENTYTCEYDAWNRLMKVKQGANVVAEYRYDGLNRRIRKFTDKDDDEWTVREFYYNAGWQLLETRKQTKTRTGNPLSEPALATTLYKQYVWGIRYIDAPVLLWRDAIGNGTLNETLYYTTDANMNVTAVVNTSGQAVERYMYDPYGKMTILNGQSGVDKDGAVTEWTDDTDQTASDVANSILFCGYYRDAETGLYHVRMRYYHIYIGWITRDGGYWDGMNVYEYVRGNPGLFIDPFGLATLHVDQSLNVSSSYDFSNMKKWCKNHFSEIDINRFADEEEILDHLDKKNVHDVWIYFGHIRIVNGEMKGVIEHDSLIKLFWMRNDLVPMSDLVKKMTSGGKKHAPGLVVLGGCKSCLGANKFLESGAQCVLCLNVELDRTTLGKLISDFMLGLCKSDRTLREAFRKAVEANCNSQEWTKADAWAQDKEVAELRCQGGAGGLTLKELTDGENE